MSTAPDTIASDKAPKVMESAQELDGVASYGTGEAHQIEQPFTTLSALSLAYSITNTAIAVLLSLGSEVYFGGAPVFFYTFIIMALVGLCAAISLAELASAFPHSGGQYNWVFHLCPKSTRRFAAYITAIFSWAGAVTTSASTVLATAQIIMGMVRLQNPDLVIYPWMTFVIFQAVNLLAFPVNMFERILPLFAKTMLIFTITSLIVIFVAVLAASPTKQSGSFMFTDLYNLSGWPDGVAFFIGMNSANWAFSCLDAATHLADELPNPRRNIPKALLLTVLVGFVTGLPILIAMFISIQNLEDVLNGASGILSMEIFLQAFSGNMAAAISLETLILVSSIGAVVGIHTWQARLAWAFSRDKGFPFHKVQSSIAPAPFRSPIAAHAWSASWTALCGCLYLASSAAFTSLISAGILLQYITYSTAICLLLWHGRKKIVHGPFWMGSWGLLCNIVVVGWTLAALVFYSLPYFLPVLAAEMNYVSVVLVIVFLYAIGYWVLLGRRCFVPPKEVVYEPHSES